MQSNIMPHRGTSLANVMFVDNPVGMGFSFVDIDGYDHELPEMADQFVKFLEKWFALFPEYKHDDVSKGGGKLTRSFHVLSPLTQVTSKTRGDIEVL